MFEEHNMVTISTGHLTVETRNAIDAGVFHRTFWTSEYGWITYSNGSDDNFPKDLVDCLVLAQDNKFDWIMFDVDGPRIDSLPYYEDD